MQPTLESPRMFYCVMTSNDQLATFGQFLPLYETLSPHMFCRMAGEGLKRMRHVSPVGAAQTSGNMYNRHSKW